MEPITSFRVAEAPTDEELVRMVHAGAFAVFEVLMRRHAPRVHRAIRSILRDETETEDAVQQTSCRRSSPSGASRARPPSRPGSRASP